MAPAPRADEKATACKPRVQCKTCPWRKGASVSRIPRYDRAKHDALADTIAKPGDLAPLARGGVRMMSCHYSTEAREIPCAGWVENQLGPGNNLALRLYARRHPEIANVRTVGPQRERFEDTFADGEDE